MQMDLVFNACLLSGDRCGGYAGRPQLEVGDLLQDPPGRGHHYGGAGPGLAHPLTQPETETLLHIRGGGPKQQLWVILYSKLTQN